MNARALLIVAVCFVGCGGDGLSPIGGGVVRIAVTNAKGAAPALLDRAQIAEYRVLISGSDFDSITVRFDATAAGGRVEGIPAGEDRRVEVTAANRAGETLRVGEARDVAVRGGEVTDVTVGLETIPLMANIRDGGAVPNTRLRLTLVGEPGHPIVVEVQPATEAMAGMPATDAAAGTQLIDAATNVAQVLPGADTGIAVLAPVPMAPGRYRLTARDLQTGRTSSAVIYVSDGTRRRGAPLVAAGRGGQLCVVDCVP